MDSPPTQPLRFLHSKESLSTVKLKMLREHSSDWIKLSLKPGQPGALKVRADGTVLDGHHRLSILLERGENIHALPREILEKSDDS